MGRVVSAEQKGSSRVFWVESAISAQLKADQSLSHEGICLTVEEVDGNRHRVTAIEETLNKTTSGQWAAGTPLNLERCVSANGRFDGHFVTGHVDGTGQCISLENRNGSYLFRFRFPEEQAHLVIEKGAICINGTSLTIFDVTRNEFSVAIIPYTWQHTTIQFLQPGQPVNLEFDMIGKYLHRRFQLEQDQKS